MRQYSFLAVKTKNLYKQRELYVQKYKNIYGNKLTRVREAMYTCKENITEIERRDNYEIR